MNYFPGWSLLSGKVKVTHIPLALKTSRMGALVGADRCTDERTDNWTPIPCHSQADATIRLYKTNTESELKDTGTISFLYNLVQ